MRFFTTTIFGFAPCIDTSLYTQLPTHVLVHKTCANDVTFFHSYITLRIVHFTCFFKVKELSTESDSGFAVAIIFAVEVSC